MAVAKRAKKFRQKHLSDKIDQKKKEKKHAQLTQSRKPKKPAAAKAAPTGPKFDVKESELFDGNGPDSADFAKYLSDSDKSDYEAEENEYLQEGASDAESEPDQPQPKTKPSAFPKVVDVKVVGQWRRALEESPAALKHVVRASAPEAVANIANEAALDALRDLLLTDVPKMVSKFFPQPDSIKGMRPTFKQFADLISQLMVDLGSNSPDELLRIVSAVRQLLPYFVEFTREFKSLVKGLVAVIVRTDRDDQVKLVAFSALREVSLSTSSSAVQALIAKQAYNSLVKAAAHTSSHTLEALNLAKNTFASLFTVENATDKPEIYQLAFQQIRQLALHLKTALDKTKHSDYDVKVIYTWQFVQSLDFWSRAISLSPGLHALIHPLCQVTLRVISLVPSQQYLPLRFYLARSLIRLARHTGVYIPLAPPLLEAVLQSNLLSKPGKAGTLQQPDFEAILHVPAGYIGTTVYQNSALEEFYDVFVEAMVLYTKSIAFPELVAPITVVLRRFVKSASFSKQSNPRVSRSLHTLCERLEENAKYIAKHRSKVNFGPRDKAAVEKFLVDIAWEDTPLGKEAVVRHKVKEERRKLAALAKEEDETHRELEAFASSDADNDDDDSENEDELEIEEALEELRN